MGEPRECTQWPGLIGKPFNRAKQRGVGLSMASGFDQTRHTIMVARCKKRGDGAYVGPSLASGGQITALAREVGPGDGDFKVVWVKQRGLMKVTFGLASPAKSGHGLRGESEGRREFECFRQMRPPRQTLVVVFSTVADPRAFNPRVHFMPIATDREIALGLRLVQSAQCEKAPDTTEIPFDRVPHAVPGEHPSLQSLIHIATLFRDPRQAREMKPISGYPPPTFPHQSIGFIETF